MSARRRGHPATAGQGRPATAARGSLLLLAAVGLFGCQEASFSALTTPPPQRTAELRDDQSEDIRAIRLSRGVALAFSCTYEDKPCRGATAKVKDPALLQVLPAYVDELIDSPYLSRSGGASPTAAFVVVGTASGRGSLTVSVEGEDYDFDVTVLDP